MGKRAKQRSKNTGKFIDVNILGVAAAAILLSYSFSFAPPSVIARSASAMLGSASIGMSAAVDENPFNTLAQQLIEKERELQGRENALDQREVILRAREAPLALYSFIIGLVVSLLVLFNFFLDWRREKKRHLLSTLVDVRKVA